MTPQTSAAAHLPLDPATTDETLATIFGAQRPGPERTPAQLQTQRAAGVALITAFRPRDPVEATYAARAAAAHYGSMECFRRAMLPDIPDNAAIRWHGKAVALSRMNTEMVRELRQCQAETPRAQPQPATRAAMPKPPAPAAAARHTAALAAKPVGRQDPMSSEREAVAAAAAAIATQLAAALAATPAGGQAGPPGRRPVAGPRAVDPRDPMSSERKSFTPAASSIMTGPAATSFLSAPPPRQSLRAALLGSAADVAAMLAAANVQARPHAQ